MTLSPDTIGLFGALAYIAALLFAMRDLEDSPVMNAWIDWCMDHFVSDAMGFAVCLSSFLLIGILLPVVSIVNIGLALPDLITFLALP